MVKPSFHTLITRPNGDRWRFEWEHGDEPIVINRLAELAKESEISWVEAAAVCREIAFKQRTQA